MTERRRCICCRAFLRSTQTEPACSPCVLAGNYQRTVLAPLNPADFKEARAIARAQCEVILDALPGTVGEIAASTGLSRQTCGERLKTLTRQGRAVRTGSPGNRKGGGEGQGYRWALPSSRREAA